MLQPPTGALIPGRTLYGTRQEIESRSRTLEDPEEEVSCAIGRALNALQQIDDDAGTGTALRAMDPHGSRTARPPLPAPCPHRTSG